MQKKQLDFAVSQHWKYARSICCKTASVGQSMHGDTKIQLLVVVLGDLPCNLIFLTYLWAFGLRKL